MNEESTASGGGSSMGIERVSMRLLSMTSGASASGLWTGTLMTWRSATITEREPV